MSIARDISRQSSKQNVTLTADQTAVTVTGGFSGSSIQVYLNGVKIIQGQDYSLNGTSGITLTQGASAGDIIEFVMRNTSNSGFSAANTGQIVDQAVTFDKLSNSGTEADNVQKRVASAWINFDGTFGSTPYTKSNGGIRSAYNIASVTDNGSGDYTVNFERTFGSSNDYAAVVTNSAENAVNTIHVFHQNGIATSSTGAAFRFRLSDAGSYSTRRNSLTVAVAVFGELS